MIGHNVREWAQRILDNRGTDFESEHELEDLAKAILVDTEVAEAKTVLGSLLSTAEMQKALNISPNTFRRIRESGDLPYYKAGHKLLFDPVEVLAALKKNGRVKYNKKESVSG